MCGRLMALDRPDDDFDDFDDFDRPERQVPGGDVPARRSEPPESRSREEYYEALRVASAVRRPGMAARRSVRNVRGGIRLTPRTGRRPRTSTSPRNGRRHILDGDKTGGGHRHGVGKPGKTEFPASWTDERVITSILDVARRPDNPPTHQDRNDTWLCSGTRDAVKVWAVVEPSGDIVTGWPEEGGPGVVRNPRRGKS
jgi:hypothetical protein